MGSDGEDPGSRVPCPRQQAWSYPQQTHPDQGLQGKAKGKSLDTDGPEPAHTFSKDSWSPENMNCSLAARRGGGCPWTGTGLPGTEAALGKALSFSGPVPLEKGWHNSWGRPRG